ncbi:MAG: YdeI/OmpD-associated family protein [Bacteroidota bacterium]
MGKRDNRIDAYIAKSADFAKPILNHLRQLVHEGCPDAEETIKWGFPHFEFRGLLCSMASFNHHCAFGFWKASLMSDSRKLLSRVGNTAMGNFGQLKLLSDLPPDKTILNYIKEASRLNDEGSKVLSGSKPAEKKSLKVPACFTKALIKNRKALQTFERFSYSNKKDYVEWVVEAKTEETKNKRLATSIEWLVEGKIRNWKYLKK